MSRLIDADKLKRRTQRVATQAWKMKIHSSVETVLNQFIDFINEAPTVDAVAVVRCGECKYFVKKQDNIGECSALLSGKFTGRYWFCADGERKEKEND